MAQIDFFEKIYSRYGNVKRSRGFYLYTEKGVRITDMYLDGGRSCLGRRIGKINLRLKQKLDKGMAGFFPTNAEAALKKVCNKFFPEFEVFVYDSVEKAFFSCTKLLEKNENYNSKNLENYLWRPFAKAKKNYLFSENSFLVFPPFATNTTLLFVKKVFLKSYSEEKNSEKNFFLFSKTANRNISQLELFTITKSFYELLQFKKNYKESFFQNPVLKLCSKIFIVEGIYLKPTKNFAPQNYEKLFDYFLENKILISPDFNTPSVFPVLTHYTELTKALIKMPAELYWK